jgi:16S rRNA (cytidine1402-2'-O)-methyltransferase
VAGILYAIPTPLGASPEESLPVSALLTVRSLRDFAVENAKSARAFLSACGCDPKLASIVEIGDDIGALLQPLRDGRPLGLLSEAGCPAIADPGAKLVEAAHGEGIRVVPLVGPSSIVLALMASGLEGQRFAFCGYLPREKAQREKRIRELELRSRREGETQIFIETPYRNDSLLEALLATCAPQTRLCVASDLTMPSESVATAPIAAWRRKRHSIGKRAAIFLLLSAG